MAAHGPHRPGPGRRQPLPGGACDRTHDAIIRGVR